MLQTLTTDELERGAVATWLLMNIHKAMSLRLVQTSERKATRSLPLPVLIR
jgi:hypothetical protein